MEILNPQAGETVLDCTVGLGGHAKAFLERIACLPKPWCRRGPKWQLIGVDADEMNLNVARKNLKEYKNVELVQGNFRNIFSDTLSIPLHPSGMEYDIIFADLGLSSPHIDDPKRGFTYREDAPLDLRFDQSQGTRAAELIARISKEELANILFQFGELRESRRLADYIRASDIQTTSNLKTCVEDAVGWRAKKLLPQVFQALRIAVNDELKALEVLLREGPKLLTSGGRMGIISYHSLEDRMVKQAFRSLDPSTYQILTKKPICPSEEEVKHNPRSRSAKFRAIKRL